MTVTDFLMNSKLIKTGHVTQHVQNQLLWVSVVSEVSLKSSWPQVKLNVAVLNKPTRSLYVPSRVSSLFVLFCTHVCVEVGGLLPHLVADLNVLMSISTHCFGTLAFGRKFDRFVELMEKNTINREHEKPKNDLMSLNSHHLYLI